MLNAQYAFFLAILGALLFAVMVLFAGRPDQVLFDLRIVLLVVIVVSEIVALILGLIQRQTAKGRYAAMLATLVLVLCAGTAMFSTAVEVGGTLPS